MINLQISLHYFLRNPCDFIFIFVLILSILASNSPRSSTNASSPRSSTSPLCFNRSIIFDFTLRFIPNPSVTPHNIILQRTANICCFEFKPIHFLELLHVIYSVSHYAMEDATVCTIHTSICFS
eukprot:357317_1